eukprot:scaffold1278_cov356-Prasinococcus_capsulatus_cf.AAC.3
MSARRQGFLSSQRPRQAHKALCLQLVPSESWDDQPGPHTASKSCVPRLVDHGDQSALPATGVLRIRAPWSFLRRRGTSEPDTHSS